MQNIVNPATQDKRLPESEKTVHTRPRALLSHGPIWFLLASVLLSNCDIGPEHLEPIAPEVPSLTAPFDGSVDQRNALYLEWTKSPEATAYHVQVSTDSTFLDLTFDQRNILMAIVPVIDLQIDSTYYWRVRAFNEVGFSDWSPTWSFTPSSPATLPSAPQLVYPPDGTGNLGTTVEFKWAAANSAKFYHIQASLERDFFSREADMIVPDTVQAVSALVFEYIYFWRVRGQNAAGFGPWSPTWFIVIAAGE